MESITQVFVENMESNLANMEKILAKNDYDRYLLNLVMHLRDILRIHEVDKLTIEQAKMLIRLDGVVNNLYTQVKVVDKDEYRQYSKDLLSVGLTWLPVTEKAQKDIENFKKELKNG